MVCNKHSICYIHYPCTFKIFLSLESPTDALVSLQLVMDTMEGNDVEVCVDLSSIPAGGLECDVVVILETADGAKAS